MKNLNLFIFASLAALSSTSCGGDAPDTPYPRKPGGKDPTEIVLSTGIEAHTRTAFTSADTQIPAGRTIDVWVHETAGTAQLYGRNTMTADGNGGLSGGTTMFFPQNDATVDIYALHTNATLTGSSYPASMLTHTVNADQQTHTGYADSDLTCAKAAGVAETDAAVPLNFRHLLSKLQVALVLRNDLTVDDVTGISIDGTRLQAGFVPDKGAAPAAIAVSALGSASPITISADISASFYAPQYNDAIIVPQTVAAGTPFITIHLTEGVDLAYLIPEETTFESNKKYIYHITVSRTEITLSTSIEDWTSGGTVTGEANHLVD